MIRLSFNGSDQVVYDWLMTKRPRLLEAIRVELDAQDIALQGHIVGDKLQGQVLHHRSGKLGASIRVVSAVIEGNMVSGGVEGAGGPAWYGRVHEYGGTYSIAATTRRQGRGASGKVLRLLTRGGAVRSSIRSISTKPVKAHERTFPERSFMRSSLEDFRQQIIDAVQNKVTEVLAE